MAKVGKSKSKALRPLRKKSAKKAAEVKRTAPKTTKRRHKQTDDARTRTSTPDQEAPRVSTQVASGNGEAETPAVAVMPKVRKATTPYLLPLAIMNIWLRALTPKGVSGT